MLDPTRLKLGAESVGYQIRCGRAVDWNSFKTALQTDYNNQGSAVQVRREAETPVNEIHSMGAQLSGQEGNSLLLTNARQARQINGYPLRHFDAQNPAVILPVKYGGLPLYNPKQVENQQYVSRFTEPLSAQLDSSTELLSRQGVPALTSDISRPYHKHLFMNPLSATKQELEANQSVFLQRMHLQRMKGKGRYAPVDTMGRNFFNKSSQNIIRGANGVPYTQNKDELISQNMEESTGFAASLSDYSRRSSNYQNHTPDSSNTGSILSHMSGSSALLPYQDDMSTVSDASNYMSIPSYRSRAPSQNVSNTSRVEDVGGIDDFEFDLYALMREANVDNDPNINGLIEEIENRQAAAGGTPGLRDPEYESSPQSAIISGSIRSGLLTPTSNRTRPPPDLGRSPSRFFSSADSIGSQVKQRAKKSPVKKTVYAKEGDSRLARLLGRKK